MPAVKVRLGIDKVTADNKSRDLSFCSEIF
jgi:hypothetical protein